MQPAGLPADRLADTANSSPRSPTDRGNLRLLIQQATGQGLFSTAF